MHSPYPTGLPLATSSPTPSWHIPIHPLPIFLLPPRNQIFFISHITLYVYPSPMGGDPSPMGGGITLVSLPLSTPVSSQTSSQHSLNLHTQPTCTYYPQPCTLSNIHPTCLSILFVSIILKRIFVHNHGNVLALTERY